MSVLEKKLLFSYRITVLIIFYGFIPIAKKQWDDIKKLFKFSIKKLHVSQVTRKKLSYSTTVITLFP